MFKLIKSNAQEYAQTGGVKRDIYSISIVELKKTRQNPGRKSHAAAVKLVGHPDADVDPEAFFLLRDGARYHNTTTTTVSRQPIHKPQVKV